MSKTATKPKTRVLDLGLCRGDCGPCDSEQCPKRAARKVCIIVGTVQTLGYVCDEHFDEIAGA